MRYKMEFHCHTLETGPCGTVPAAKFVRLHKEAGYDGLMISDHFSAVVQGSHDEIDWQAAVDHLLRGYRLAKAEGDKIGLDVFLGAEIRFPGSDNDYLLLGLTEEFLRQNPWMYELTQEECYKLLDQNGLLLVQAHPFRDGCTPADPRYLHGAEAYNGHKGQPNHNDRAEAFTAEHGLIATAGSDCHYKNAVGTTAVIFPEAPRTTADIVRHLRAGTYELEKN